MDHEDKLKLVKKFQLKNETIDKFISKFNKITDLPKNTELELLSFMAALNQLSVEMTLENFKNIYSSQLEHELDREIRTTQIQDQFTNMMKKMGIDMDTFKRFRDQSSAE